MKRTPIFVLALTGALILPAPVAAQTDGATDVEARLRSMVTTAPDAEIDRDAILDFLARDEVTDVASAQGLDVDALKDGVRALDDDASRDLVERIRDMQQEVAQVGGDTIVITSTTVIIVLLVLILIAVA